MYGGVGIKIKKPLGTFYNVGGTLILDAALVPA